MNILGYDVEVTKLQRELGGGFVAFARSLPGCVSDGETRAEAARNVEDAIDCWLTLARERGLRIPPPECNAGKASETASRRL